MKAVIMAGGEGTRLRPLTCSIPKPMATVAGKPVMGHILELLHKNGINEAAVSLLYLPLQVKDFFGDEAYGVKLTYFEEGKPLGTAGGVKNCQSFFDDTFLVISGDAACSFDLKQAINAHKQKKADATLILYKTEEPLEYGVVVTEPDGRINSFIEKPSWNRAYSDTINTGIYILEKHCLDLMPENIKYDFGKDLFPLMLKNKMNIYGYEAKGYWCDIGSPEAYMQCNIDALDGRFPCNIEGQKVSDGVYSQTAIVSKPIILPPAVIGKNVSISDGAVIGPYAIIGDNSVIQENASLKRSVIYENCFFGALCEIRGAVLAKGCIVKEGARIFEGAVIGENCVLGKKSLIDKNIKLWPAKRVEDNTRVTDNIIWGIARQSLFDDEGITGDTGLDMTPELSAKIGASLCSASKNRIIVTADTGGNGAKMLSMAFISGVLSAGGEVYDVKKCSECVWRFAVKEYGAGLGAYISENAGRTAFKICGAYGLPTGRETERMIESAFQKEDVNRQTKDIKAKEDAGGINGLYRNALIKYCSVDLTGLAVIVHCPEKSLLNNIEAALKKLNCKIGTQGISFFISPDGMLLSCSDEKGNYYSPEHTAAVLAKACAVTGCKKISVPYDFPVAIDSVAASMQLEVERLGEDITECDKETNCFFDACFGIIKILWAMKMSSKTLNQLAASIPSFHIAVSSVEAQASKGAVMKMLASYKEGEKELKDGIRLKFEQGNVLITPMRKGKQFIIKAEAVNAETANELCGNIGDFIKSIKQGD